MTTTFNISTELWNDYSWQMHNSFFPLDTIKEKLTESEIKALDVQERIQITPYTYSMIDFKNLECPIRRQLFLRNEVIGSTQSDFLAEDAYLIGNNIIHKYSNRVALLATNKCASYCAYCTRKRVKYASRYERCDEQIIDAIDYIARTERITDVLISGGDPLILGDSVIESILKKLRGISHVKVIRIGTRIPFFLPMRVTSSLCEILKRYAPIYINIHVNHPSEITIEFEEACTKLIFAGCILGSQSVLLRTINDNEELLTALFQKLISIGIKPYYLFQCDPQEWCSEFITMPHVGPMLINNIQHKISGLAVPKFAIDLPYCTSKKILGPSDNTEF